MPDNMFDLFIRQTISDRQTSRNCSRRSFCDTAYGDNNRQKIGGDRYMESPLRRPVANSNEHEMVRSDRSLDLSLGKRDEEEKEEEEEGGGGRELKHQ
jgi:hypothetical protein